MRIAIVQDGPVYLDAQATYEKTKDFILQAATKGADLIVFGENWFSGYPVWLDVCSDIHLWDYPPVKNVWARTFTNGLSLGSTLFQAIQDIVKDVGIYVIMGANEPIATGKGNGTVYNTIYTFDPTGTLVNHHRKLMPTFTEKLVHGLGDGAGLLTITTPFGKIGSLICWEHWMPLARQAMHDEGEEIHFALWPYVKDMHHIACRHYAHEGRCHVVAVGQVMHLDELPNELALSDKVNLGSDKLLLQGGSAVYAPDGNVLLAPQYGDRGIIYVEIHPESSLPERMNLAVSGHYQRPDVFTLTVKKTRS